MEGPLVSGHFCWNNEMDAFHFALLGFQSVEAINVCQEVGVRDRVANVFIGVSIWERSEKSNGVDIEIRLFLCFPNHHFFETFTKVGESAGDSVFTFARFAGPFDYEEPSRLVENQGTGGAGRIEVEREIAIRAADTFSFVE